MGPRDGPSILGFSAGLGSPVKSELIPPLLSLQGFSSAVGVIQMSAGLTRPLGTSYMASDFPFH